MWFQQNEGEKFWMHELSELKHRGVQDILVCCVFFFSSRRRHTRWTGDWSSDVCSSDLVLAVVNPGHPPTWSCWLTRRLVLSLLENGGKFLASTSTLVQRAAPEARREVAARSEERRVGKECRARWSAFH